MFKSVFVNFNEGNLIVFGFFLFLAVFLGSLIWTFTVQQKSFYNEMSRIPLKDSREQQP